MRIVVTGAAGQLGRECVAALSALGTVTGRDLPDLDIVSPESVERMIRVDRPDAVVNCAAYTRVDDAERDVAAARAVNADGPRVLAAACARHGLRLVHISTDYVFDGRKPVPQPYVETDPVHPLSVYGITKLEGEQAVAAAGGNFAILRTAWLYGRYGQNFVKTILRLALRPGAPPLRVVNDQHGAPTCAATLARQVAEVVRRDLRGLLHATAHGHATWFDFASAILAGVGSSVRPVPVSTAEFPRPAPRPANSILENRALMAQSADVMRDWRSDLAEFLDRHGADLVREAREKTA